MRDMNVTCISGRLTRDPELRAAGDSSVCQLGVAVNENYKDGSEWKERPAGFFDVVVWGGQGENAARYLTKGSRVFVQGRLKQRSWETPDGSKRSKVEIVAEVLLWPPVAEAKPRENPGDFDAGNDFDFDFGGDDVPF